MKRIRSIQLSLACLSLISAAAPAAANVLGQHHLTWWDDINAGVIVTLQGAAPPTQNAMALFNMDEWHLDQAQTSQWYAGAAIAGLPPNPFNPAVRTGIIGAPVPVNNAEGFIYQITNLNYGSGNGMPAMGPFSFTMPVPPGPGINDLSGINIVDTHGALGISAPVAGSQFMFTTLNPAAPTKVLDLTPASAFGAIHDWDFNAYSGAGNFEWDIRSENGAGIVIGLQPAVFGFAMPGNWLDAVNDGWAHSWSASLPPPPPPPSSIQVNFANSANLDGYSGPAPIPEPATWVLMICGGLGLSAWRLRQRAGSRG